MRSTRRSGLVFFVMIAALAVAGCSSGTDEASPSTTAAMASSTSTSASGGSSSPGPSATTSASPTVDGFCDAARQITTEVGDDPLEIDEHRKTREGFDGFGSRLVTLDGLFQTMAAQAPDAIRGDVKTFADAVHGFTGDAKSASSADELVSKSRAFDSGALGQAGDRIEDYVEATCHVDLDLD